MEVNGSVLSDKESAGAAILEACKNVTGLEPVKIGSYRGFSMSLTLENFSSQYVLTMKGEISHRVELGKDAHFMYFVQLRIAKVNPFPPIDETST